MRVLQVITDTDRRGAQIFALDLEAALRRKGVAVSTVALVSGQPDSASLDVDAIGDRARGGKTILQLRRRMGEVDVTIAHGSSTGLACALACKPFVYRQISDTRFWAASWPRRLRVAAYLRRACAVVALSATAKSALVEHLWLPANRIHVVPNGVPASTFRECDAERRHDARTALGLDPAAFVALYVGALAPEKGVDVAIGAAGVLDGLLLAIAGGGPDEARLKKLAESTPRAKVEFLGVLADVGTAYSAADVVLLPSLGGDSMPATLIEAGLCGLPAVATPVGSITDIVVDGVTGLIVPAGDRDALSVAIDTMRCDVARARRMGQRAREHCLANFDIDVVAAGWMRVLRQ